MGLRRLESHLGTFKVQAPASEDSLKDDQKMITKASKNLSKSMPKSIKIDSRGSFWAQVEVILEIFEVLARCFLLKVIFDRFLTILASYFEIYEASWGPSWLPSWVQNRHLTSLEFRLRFRRGFGGSWTRFWEPFGV